ncbi:hypothetical protein V9T40_012019 [Parthenolecanium corni]|uniref:Uncharacterized protein n=1 Tax=Parthenolecanium corni TaxID=536013 RepID=A0AAN9Y036_9HEMI
MIPHEITLLFLCACVALISAAAANNSPTPKDKRDKRQLLPFGYGGYGYPYYGSYPYASYPYGYGSPYTTYSTYGAYASPFAYPGVAAPIVTAPFGYFR